MGVSEMGAVSAVFVDQLRVNFFTGFVDDGAIAVSGIKVVAVRWNYIMIEQIPEPALPGGPPAGSCHRKIQSCFSITCHFFSFLLMV